MALVILVEYSKIIVLVSSLECKDKQQFWIYVTLLFYDMVIRMIQFIHVAGDLYIYYLISLLENCCLFKACILLCDINPLNF